MFFFWILYHVRAPNALLSRQGSQHSTHLTFLFFIFYPLPRTCSAELLHRQGSPQSTRRTFSFFWFFTSMFTTSVLRNVFFPPFCFRFCFCLLFLLLCLLATFVFAFDRQGPQLSTAWENSFSPLFLTSVSSYLLLQGSPQSTQRTRHGRAAPSSSLDG
jgi:hypothetical protein